MSAVFLYEVKAISYVLIVLIRLLKLYVSRGHTHGRSYAEQQGRRHYGKCGIQQITETKKPPSFRKSIKKQGRKSGMGIKKTLTNELFCYIH